ncbi:ABC transporter ATP-binding protein [Intrasporangium flavum]|uniref:ABC transporter ATP-binding protein n=1 Tax=Intrasporangium flavum TaxID=1428657 RepID=UPI00096C061F|nr:ABC transporter ATP-binding protein [Intrasporangium flavum]
MTTVARRVRLWLVLGFGAAPGLTATGLAIAVAGAVLAPLATLGVGRVVDGLTAGDGDLARQGLWLVAAGIVVGVLQAVSWPLVWFFVDDLGERFARHRVLRLIAGIPTVAHHDLPEMADRVSTLRREARDLGAAGQRLGTDASTVVGTVTLAGVLGSIAWWLALLVPAALLPAWASGRAFRARYEAERHNEQAIRAADRLLDIARGPATGLEVRCSGAPATLVDALGSALDERMSAVAEASRVTRPFAVVTRLAWIALLAVAVVGVFASVRAGSLGVGSLVVLVLLVPQVESMATMLQGLVARGVRTAQHLARLDELEQYAAGFAGSPAGHPSDGDASSRPWRLERGIELVDVGFTYPGATSPSLEGVTLHLDAGTTVALVGENGAGKSTLVMLLARLHDPTRGRIRVDGRPLTELPHASWHERLGAVFQDHTDPHVLVHEAVGIGDLDGATDERVDAALGRADASGLVAALPRGRDTQLGRQFAGGTDLSGGQWQRLAVARGLLREEPLLMLLDEPSSALDAAAEDAILGGYLSRAREVRRRTGGITVVVSHRLSTVRAADRIVVLEGGRVVEDGTHDELVAAGGPYAELFDLQARSYR